MEHTFKPFPLLINPHLMTLLSALRLPNWDIISKGKLRLFDVEPQSKIAAYINRNTSNSSSAIVIVHGLEGSASSPFVVGLADKALRAGIDVIRLNLRNCGGTMHLSPTLYNAGLSADVIAVVQELKERDEIGEIFLAGYSLGGNIVLKAAAELASKGSQYIAGVCAISPSLDLPSCVEAMERGINRVYEQHFLMGLKAKLRAKYRLFPDLYNISKLNSVKTLRRFDDLYTAPHGGYGNAENYYRSASALPIADQIRVPTLIIFSHDDPIVPSASFQSAKLRTPYIKLLATGCGGHTGFIQRHRESGKFAAIFDRFWAENRVVEFCLTNSKLSV